MQKSVGGDLSTQKPRWDRNLRSIDNNPCIQEQDMSYKCMSENNYDRDSCTAFFLNYRNCRDFWQGVQRERRQKGIKPYIPPPGERAAIKEEKLKQSKQ